MPKKPPSPEDLLDKQAAAKYISTEKRPISVRKIELLATDGRIGRSYIPGKRGKQVRFKRVDLDKLKQELEGEAVIEQPASSLVRSSPHNLAQPGTQGFANNDMGLAVLALMERLSGPVQHASVPIADKVSLTLAEAIELSGMSESAIRGHMGAGRIRHDYTGPRGSLRLSKADIIKCAESFES